MLDTPISEQVDTVQQREAMLNIVLVSSSVSLLRLNPQNIQERLQCEAIVHGTVRDN